MCVSFWCCQNIASWHLDKKILLSWKSPNMLGLNIATTANMVR